MAHTAVRVFWLCCSLCASARVLVAASPVLCGFPCVNSSQCMANGDCSRCSVDIGVAPASAQCVPSCGFSCSHDSDCGSSAVGVCSACVDGHCSGNAKFGQCTQQAPRPAGSAQAPVLPSAWNASFVMVNYTDGSTGYGRMWYDTTWQAMRQDFAPVCPFLMLANGADNNGPCSVIFLEGLNYYVYPSTSASVKCCGYKFPVWAPDAYRAANASFGGHVQVNFQTTDFWRFEYTCPWIRPATNATKDRLPAYTVQRNVYLRTGTNIPVRMNETLTSGYSDFFEVNVGAQTRDTFSSVVDAQKCSVESDDPLFLQHCFKYSSNGRLVYLGYS